ncbi:Hypothetical protein AA314_08759 [Archangium gephyra]|uniref:Uncharacterized protein n=1 Tax=Archangium gephyra TaxID=48 RepID=A0AAC8QGM7_9BACT|nr:Hypothetical protein AA314_08759 [Archangium gephyra]
MLDLVRRQLLRMRGPTGETRHYPRQQLQGGHPRQSVSSRCAHGGLQELALPGMLRPFSMFFQEFPYSRLSGLRALAGF